MLQLYSFACGYAVVLALAPLVEVTNLSSLNGHLPLSKIFAPDKWVYF